MTTETIYIDYIAVNQINGKLYVGKSGEFLTRKQTHIREAKNGSNTCPIFYPALRKYGPENFKWYKLYETHDEAIAYVMEKFFIGIYNTNGTLPNSHGYNANDGGEGGCGSFTGKKHSEESKIKMSVIKLGTKASDEAKHNMSLAQEIRWQNPEFVKRHKDSMNRPEVIDKIIKGNKNRIITQETKDKHSKISKQLWKDPEYVKKQQAGFNSPKTKKKISDASKIMWDNPEYKQRELEKRQTKEARELHSDSAKKMWSKSKPSRSKDLINRNSKSFRVIFPDGHTEIITNLKKFCIEHDLKYHTVYASYKRGSTHKSFTFLDV